MQTCEVLIVGGGPAGSSCAWRLKRHGLDVLVMDKAVFPRDKVCAGWITPQVVDALELDLAEYAHNQVLQRVTGFRTGLMHQRLLETRFNEVVSYAIRRCEFDHYLLQRSGARLRAGEALNSLERVAGDWIINGTLRTPMLVGAGGHSCPVARHMAMKPDPLVPVVVAQEAEVALEPGQICAVQGDTPELYFCNDLKGYGWCVRKGAWLNIGLGREDRRDLPAHVDRFCQSLYQMGRIPRLPPRGFKGHAYLLHGHGSRPLVMDAALLIGDAAGLAYPQSGEGIRPAVESGLLAADVIAGVRPRFEAQRLDAYRARLVQRLGCPRRMPAAKLSELKTMLAAPLLGNRWLTRTLLLERWLLHRSVSPLGAAGS